MLRLILCTTMVSLLVAMPGKVLVAGVNTDRPTTGDLLWRHGKLKQYLASRRAHLSALREEIQELDVMLLEKRGSMSASLKALKAMALVEGESRADRDAAQQELERMKQESGELYKRLLAAERRKAELEKERLELPGQIAADEEAINALNTDITLIQKQMDVLDRAYQRTLNQRSLQAARP